MSDLKFCKDCKHMIPHHGGTAYAKCGAYANPAGYIDLVTGADKRFTFHPYCSEWRSSGTCGNEGKQWEPKDPVYDPTTILDLFRKKSFWQHLKGLLGGCPTGGGGP